MLREGRGLDQESGIRLGWEPILTHKEVWTLSEGERRAWKISAGCGKSDTFTLAVPLPARKEVGLDRRREDWEAMTVFRTGGEGSMNQGRVLTVESEEQIGLGNSPRSA